MALSESWRKALEIADNSLVPWDSFKHSTVVVTGSTGLIGSQLVRAIIEWSRRNDGGVNLILPVRNIKKARSFFGEYKDITYLQWSIADPLPSSISGDYFVHAACPTSSDAFLHRPVEVISEVVKSTESVINLLREKKFKHCVYLSTMEIYGDVKGKVDEHINGIIDTMNPRSSYPEAKRLSECLLSSAVSEYGISASVLRLSQTFGVGVPKNDGRVFAEFGRCAVNGNDIILYSDGSKRNSYLSVNDAVAAILFLLAYGKTGEAYNAANPATFCSILDMASLVVQEYGKGRISVLFGSDSERSKSFRHGNILDLDCGKLLALGWSPVESLRDMYTSMLSGWLNNE